MAILILATGLLAGTALSNASPAPPEAGTYRFGADQHGNLRLLSSELAEGSSELRDNETLIELLSSQPLQTLQNMIADLEARMSEIEATVAQHSDSMTEQEQAIQELAVNLSTLQVLVNEIEHAAGEQTAIIDGLLAMMLDLESRVIELEENSGGSAGSNMSDIITGGLVLYAPLYELDSLSFVSQDSYGHPCVIIGTKRRADGRVFTDSNNVIECGNSPVFDMFATSGLTIEAWVKYTNTTTNGKQRIVDKERGSDGYAFWVNNTTRTIVHRWNGGTSYTSTESIKDRDWSHVAFTYDSSTTYLYLEGLLSQLWSETLTLTDNTQDVRIGNNAAQNRPFNGWIGEVRIYNRALAIPEIRHNYLATKARYE
jgi:uncharacterized coiled-coil protein SlyX